MDIKTILNSQKAPDNHPREKTGWQTVTNFLVSLTIEYLDSSNEKIDQLIDDHLTKLASIAKADRCYIYQFDKNFQSVTLSHHFTAKGVKNKIPCHDQINSDDFSWLLESILKNSPLKVGSQSESTRQSGTLKAIMEVEKTQSMFLYPLYYGQRLIGMLGLDSTSHDLDIDQSREYLLTTAGKIFSAAIVKAELHISDMADDLKYKRLFTDIDDIIFISTPEGRIIDINPTGLELFGYKSLSEISAVDISQDLYQNPDDREKYKRIMDQTGRVKDYELSLKNRSGQKISVLETSVAVRDDQDKIIYYQGILRDVTRKRPLEEQIFQAKKLESIGMLAGGVAHDFNNILTTISGYAELILMDTDQSSKNYADLENILKGVKRAEDLIHQLLAFSRKQMIEPKIVDLNEVIKELHTMLSRLISEDIRFELNLKDNLNYIKADPVQIQQILVNLVVNANYAIKKLGETAVSKRITISTSDVDVNKKSISQYPGLLEGKYILISVIDTGMGMDEETQKNIFEPFFSTKKGGEGTGLGLSTVYGIVKQNQGNIYVESKPHRGTIFNIYWPTTAEAKTFEFRKDTDLQFRPHTETILFVEDDANVRELMCTGLKAMGYKVIEAENGRHAMETLKKKALINKIDLVISDIVMPEMGGEELADSLRKLNPDIKILLCSGFTDSRISMSETHTRNGYSFLPKPYTIKKMEKKITSILQNNH
jgi:two-component system cell cycle sensor histidine kinase/response regulator CckA